MKDETNKEKRIEGLKMNKRQGVREREREIYTYIYVQREREREREREEIVKRQS